MKALETFGKIAGEFGQKIDPEYSPAEAKKRDHWYHPETRNIVGAISGMLADHSGSKIEEGLGKLEEFLTKK